jgi:hypothetical protein
LKLGRISKEITKIIVEKWLRTDWRGVVAIIFGTIWLFKPVQVLLYLKTKLT